MTRIGTLRETFDRDMDFVAVKPFKLAGTPFNPGQNFDKTQVTTRRLRQLYDCRYLRMVEPEDPIVRQARSPVVVDIGNRVEPEVAQPPARVKRVARVKR